MSSWSCGNIRYLGYKEDILKCIGDTFLFATWKEGPDNQLETVTKPAIIVPEDNGNILVKDPFSISAEYKKSWCWIKGTERNFIHMPRMENQFRSVMSDHHDPSKKDIIIFNQFQAAWKVNPIPYLHMSKKYKIAIRIFSWNLGAKTRQEILADNGSLKHNITNKSESYFDWMWESEWPYLGG